MDPLTEVELGFLLIPLAGFVYGMLEEWHRGRSPPATVVAVDDPAFGGMPTMVSDRWGLSGRPDELRRLHGVVVCVGAGERVVLSMAGGEGVPMVHHQDLLDGAAASRGGMPPPRVNHHAPRSSHAPCATALDH